MVCVKNQREFLQPLKSDVTLFLLHLMKKEVALSVLFRGFSVVSFNDSWCSAPTGGGDRLFTGFGLFDSLCSVKVNCTKCKRNKCCKFGPQSN